ncbi:MAG TPA: tRNA (adenosine(37)-N6)-threonylcarbamoyltransferase complex transferase subunit TsaD, partial [Anaerolineae bacterium]|nr:tRNA (adenosine(37)-N6)-threonylcarbamoyltransferase complex transferase subunit TsaD [Anaerolineae bacterium]
MAVTRILAIETSCDETAAAVIGDGRRILSNVVASQVELHARYGGVFPEIASRAHVEAIVPVIEQAMREAHLGFDDLDAVAVTYGPGLAGSLLVGVNAAKGLALGRGLPLLGVNHLEAHIYAHWLEVESERAATPPPQARGPGEGRGLEFPLLALIVSGGHTELVLVHDHGQYEYLGGTLDDAAGEAFDKVGRLLGLPYPGGPAIQRAARDG